MRLFSNPRCGRMVMAAALLALGSCTVVVDDDTDPGLRPIEEPGFCTREYEPVCGRRGGDRQTFANGCLADAAGYRVISDGECRRRRDDDEERQFCTREYRPVCGVRRGNTRTFPNACEARAADYRIVEDGPC